MCTIAVWGLALRRCLPDLGGPAPVSCQRVAGDQVRNESRRESGAKMAEIILLSQSLEQ